MHVPSEKWENVITRWDYFDQTEQKYEDNQKYVTSIQMMETE